MATNRLLVTPNMGGFVYTLVVFLSLKISPKQHLKFSVVGTIDHRNLFNVSVSLSPENRFLTTKTKKQVTIIAHGGARQIEN